MYRNSIMTLVRIPLNSRITIIGEALESRIRRRNPSARVGSSQVRTSFGQLTRARADVRSRLNANLRFSRQTTTSRTGRVEVRPKSLPPVCSRNVIFYYNSITRTIRRNPKHGVPLYRFAAGPRCNPLTRPDSYERYAYDRGDVMRAHSVSANARREKKKNKRRTTLARTGEFRVGQNAF